MPRIKSLNLQEICHFGLAFVVDSLSVSKLQWFEMVGAISTVLLIASVSNVFTGKNVSSGSQHAN